MRVADIETLVLCGGGIAGISYIGVLDTLYREVGFDFFSKKTHLRHVIGVSVGSVFGLVIACGLRSANDLQDTYLPMLMGKSGVGFVMDPNPVTLVKHWGVDDGSRAKKLLERCLELRGLPRDTTFRRLREDGAPLLSVVVTNVTRGQTETMSFDTTPDMEVVQAILMSIALPPFFAPVKHPTTGDLYVDGCMLQSIPAASVSPESTLVLRIQNNLCSPAASLPSYFTCLIQLLLTENSKKESVPDGLRVLTVDTADRTAFDFSLSQRVASQLMLRGIEATQAFLAENPLEPYQPTRSIGTQTIVSVCPKKKKSKA